VEWNRSSNLDTILPTLCTCICKFDDFRGKRFIYPLLEEIGSLTVSTPLLSHRRSFRANMGGLVSSMLSMFYEKRLDMVSIHTLTPMDDRTGSTSS